jgi:hypothetical protein
MSAAMMMIYLMLTHRSTRDKELVGGGSWHPVVT